jgi:hypothetical protein
MTQTSHSDNSARLGRDVLGCLLESPDLWPKAAQLDAEHFHGYDRQIFAAIQALRLQHCDADIVSVNAHLGDKVPVEYISGLIDGIVRPNFESYVRQLREAYQERKFSHLAEQLQAANSKDERLGIVGAIQTVLQNSQADGNSTELIVIRGDRASEKPLRWMWKPYLPLGKLVHFGGNSSQAKSPVTIDLAARISIGASWPDGTANTQGPRSVVLLNIEDDLEDTILPRFRLAGGDKSKLYYVKGTRVPVGESGSLERGLTLESDMQHLTQLARSLPDLGIVIVDPVTNYLGGKKMIVEEDMRALLTPLASLSAELGIVVITVGHFNRREKGTDPLHRMMGAAAFSGVARAVYAFGSDPDEESKYCHVMTVVRSCGGEGAALRYRTELVTEHCPDSFTTEIVKVVWTGTSEATAQDAVDSASTQDKTQEHEAALMLKSMLRDGRKSANECHAMLKAEGYDLDKLNAGRIRRKAGAESKKFPSDKHYSWFLPNLNS